MAAKTRLFLLTTVSSLALAGAAAAADFRMPVKAPAEMPIWVGPYIGINGGVGWHRWRFIDVDNQTGLVPPPAAFIGTLVNNEFWSGTEGAFTIGGQAGYNWQSGRVVFGVEADVNYLGASSSFSVTTNSPSANTVTTANTRWDWYATLRGRLGVMLSPTMVYVTGGLAAAHVKDSFIATFPAFLAAGPTAIDRNLWGYAVGAGIEHLFTPDWSIKLEGMYIGLPTISTAARMSNNTYRSEFKHSLALIRLGINRKLRPN